MSLSSRCQLPSILQQIRGLTTWTESNILTDRKSKFQARCTKITSCLEIPSILQYLKSSDKHIKKATHPTMLAWRTADVVSPVLPLIQNSITSKIKAKASREKLDDKRARQKIKYTNLNQGYDDCGEGGAGQRILSVLESHDVVNVLVVVSRWYGGSPLGPSRFRHISVVVSNSLKAGGFID